MDADEVLTGRKKQVGAEDTIADALYWIHNKPLSQDELAAIKPQKPSLPTFNPSPVIKFIDIPRSDKNKFGKGILFGLKWTF